MHRADSYRLLGLDLDWHEDALDYLDDYTGDLDRVQIKRVLVALDFELDDCD